MARPIWKGHISFGLVNIPVSLYPAENRVDLDFRMLDSRNRARVRYKRVNETTGEEVPWQEIVKAYELEPENYVILEEEDFKRAAPEATQSVEIDSFVDESSIQTVYFEKPYFVLPGKRAEKGYVILREALRRTRKIGIARVVIRSRQHLCALIPLGSGLVLELLRYKEELRDASEYEMPGQDPAEYNISEKELAIAEKLVENMADEWEPQKYRDEYRDTLKKYIEEKAEAGGVMPSPGRAPDQEVGKVVDIMELLKQSVQNTARRKRPERKQRRTAAGNRSAGTKKAVGDDA